jgi:hypothetical protein
VDAVSGKVIEAERYANVYEAGGKRYGDVDEIAGKRATRVEPISDGT